MGSLYSVGLLQLGGVWLLGVESKAQWNRQEQEETYSKERERTILSRPGSLAFQISMKEQVPELRILSRPTLQEQLSKSDWSTANKPEFACQMIIMKKHIVCNPEWRNTVLMH